MLTNFLHRVPYFANAGIFYVNQFALCSGGGIGVVCSPTEFKVPGSVAEGGTTFFISNFLYLSFPEQFARHIPISFSPSSSLLSSYASCTKDTNVLCSVPVHYHCLCWDPAIRTKLVLHVSKKAT